MDFLPLLCSRCLFPPHLCHLPGPFTSLYGGVPACLCMVHHFASHVGLEHPNITQACLGIDIFPLLRMSSSFFVDFFHSDLGDHLIASSPCGCCIRLQCRRADLYLVGFSYVAAPSACLNVPETATTYRCSQGQTGGATRPLGSSGKPWLFRGH